MLFSFLGFGLAMGLVFPLYAQFFVTWKPGMELWFNLGCLLAGGAIGVANYALVRLVLLRKLQMISNVANAISNQDITHHCEIESHDLIGAIVASFNHMAETLRGMINEIGVVTCSLDDSAHKMEEITSQTQQGVEQQRSQINQVATAMEEMTATVQEVAQHASEAANATRQAEQEAQDGRQVVKQAAEVIDTLDQAVAQGGEAIRRLQNDSNNIGSVLDVIKGIAEQTNLLALNAAIEAARAGEQGRGFAVVADEVRSLASRTQESTLEIQEMISRLQVGSADAVREMEASQKHAQEGVTQAARAADSLHTITEAIARINEMNIYIANAAEEQSAVSNEISQNLTSINQVAGNSVSGVHQSLDTSVQLSQLASQLRTVIGSFKV